MSDKKERSEKRKSSHTRDKYKNLFSRRKFIGGTISAGIGALGLTAGCAKESKKKESPVKYMRLDRKGPPLPKERKHDRSQKEASQA